ncbi:MAG: hypothetical protein K6E83_08840 [Clostridium sp.]|nr:hypothetical protein [Clostridium sp.]
MKKLLLLGLCAGALLFGGCTKSTIVNPHEYTLAANPDFEEKKDVEIEWQQVSDDAKELFLNTEDYPYAKDLVILLEPTEKKLQLLWVVADDFPEEELDRYAEDLVKEFNNIVASQDFSIERAGTDSYGGLWKEYGLSVGIIPESTKEDPDTWFMDVTYEAGTDFKLPNTSEALAYMENQPDDGEEAEEDTGEKEE